MTLLATCAADRLVDARDRGAAARRLRLGRAAAQRGRGLAGRAAHRGGPGASDPARPDTSTLPCLSIRLGRTKTTEADEDASVLLVGRPVEVLQAWLARADIAKGPVFRAIDRWGNLDDPALTPQAVNLILKRRIGGRARSQGVFRARAARRLSDRGGPARHFAARSHAAVAAPFRPAGGPLLQ